MQKISSFTFSFFPLYIFTPAQLCPNKLRKNIFSLYGIRFLYDTSQFGRVASTNQTCLFTTTSRSWLWEKENNELIEYHTKLPFFLGLSETKKVITTVSLIKNFPVVKRL